MVVRLVLTCVDPGTCELQGFVLAACHLCALGCGAAGFWPLGQLRMLRLLLGSSSCFWLLPPAWGEQMLYSLIFLVDMAFWWSKLLHANWQIAMTCSSPLEMTKSIGLILFEILVPKMCVCVHVEMVSFLFGPKVWPWCASWKCCFSGSWRWEESFDLVLNLRINSCKQNEKPHFLPKAVNSIQLYATLPYLKQAWKCLSAEQRVCGAQVCVAQRIAYTHI